MINSCCCEVAS